MGNATINDKKFEKEITYYIDDRLKKNLDTKIIPSLAKKDKDRIIAIDGAEGSGKSTLAMQIGKYVDNSLDLSRVVFSAEEFRDAVFKANKGQCIIYDEAFTGLSSRSSLSMINRALVSLMMQMRQKNLFVIIVLPTFFLLDKYVALFRTIVLIHVYESRGIRGYFKVYNRKSKKLLYLLGKMTYTYNNKKVHTNFKGRFYGKFALGFDEEEELYRSKKSKALEDTEKNPMTTQQIRYMQQRDRLIYLFKRMMSKSYTAMSEYFKTYGIDMSDEQIRRICLQFGDKDLANDGTTPTPSGKTLEE
jgi:hypothetical protein